VNETARGGTFGEKGWLGALLDEALAAPLSARPDASADEFARSLLYDGTTLGLASKPGSVSAEPGHAQALLCTLLATLVEMRALLERPGEARTPLAARAALALSIADAAAHERAVSLLREALETPEDERAEGRVRRAERLLEGWVSGWAEGLGHLAGGLPLHSAQLLLSALGLLRAFRARQEGGAGLPRRLALLRLLDAAARTSAVELAAGLFAPSDDGGTAERQVRSMGLRSPHRQRALLALTQPRDVETLAPLLPRASLARMLQAIALDAMIQRRWTDAMAAQVAAVMPEPAALTALLEATRRLAAGANEQVAALERTLPERWQVSIEGATDRLAELAQALANEVRETGELGTLLARSAAGETLTTEERARMREQLIDVAKAVPSLAVLVAPGGSLLLPLLLKYLPFDLRPSSFQPKTRPERSRPR
jgi:hypothetical protein